MSEESSIKITARSDKVSQLDLQNNQHRVAIGSSYEWYLPLLLFSSKRLFTHFSTHTNALTAEHTVAHT